MLFKRTVTENGEKVTIAVSGKFNYTAFTEFKATFADSTEPVSTYDVDLSGVTHMDSSALGMLIILKEHARDQHATVRIVNPSNPAKRSLSVSLFDKLFEIVNGVAARQSG